MRLADENRIDILRKKALILEHENARLVDEVVRLNKEILALKEADEEQLQQALALLEKKLAASTAALEESARKVEEQATQDPQRGGEGKKKKKQTGHGPREQKALPIEEVVHDLDDAQKTCATCGGVPAHAKGLDDVTEEVSVIERRFVMKKHVRLKYVCKCGCMTSAPLPPRLVPGGRYGNDVAIEISTMKYVDQTPLDRVVRIFRREGLEIDSQTAWDQVAALARKLRPAWERLRTSALEEYVVGLDQTHWKQIGQSKFKQMWELSTPTIAYFDIADTKGAVDGERILRGFQGVVLCDAFSTHEALTSTGLRLAHCWSHPRVDAEELKTTDPIRAEAIIGFIRELYDIEKEGAGDLERLRVLRDVKSRDVLRRFDAWILEQRLLPSSPTAKLLRYLSNHRIGFERFLSDPRIPIDNNLTERGYLWPAIGRRSFIGTKSKRGNEVAAIFYSFAESSRRNRIDAKEYLRIALDAALAGKQIPLPHEIAKGRAESAPP